MQPFLFKLISGLPGAPRLTKSLPRSPREDFPAVIREARTRLGLADLGKASSTTRLQSSSKGQAKEKAGKKNAPDGAIATIRDLEPLSVLLQVCGVPAERVTVFLDSLKRDHPDGKVPTGELLGRTRALIRSETGGNGQVLLEPRSRLALESGLTRSGWSPKESERLLSLCSSADGKVDVEKFLRSGVLRAQTASDAQKNQPRTEGKEAEAGSTAGTSARAGSPENPVPAVNPKKRAEVSETARGSASKISAAGAGRDLADALRPGGEGANREGTLLSFKTEERKTAPGTGGAGRGEGVPASREPGSQRAAESPADPSGKPPKAFSLSGPRGSQNEEPAASGSERGKAVDEGDAPKRTPKEPRAEEGRSSVETRGAPAAGPGLQQQAAKPATAQTQPLPLSEDPVPAHIAAQVSRQISRALISGEPVLRMHLNPPELGTLEVQLRWSQDALKIEMVTDRYQSRDLILASASELKESLGDQGFRVEKMDVAVNDPSGQPLSQSGGEQRRSSSHGLRLQEQNGGFPSETRGEENPSQTLTSPEGRLVDLVA